MIGIVPLIRNLLFHDPEADLQRSRRDRKRFASGRKSGGVDAGHGGGWGIGGKYDEDALNKNYLESLPEVIAHAQNLDVNNPDVHGMHRMRTAQVIGAGVKFKHLPKALRIGITPEKAEKIAEEVDELRKEHSDAGGFDSTGYDRSEGKQQERAILTMLVIGQCLIHRVWKTGSSALLPFSIELITGSRISTPFDKQGDPKVSYGIEYTDSQRTKVTGFWVRRVSKTIGDSFILDTVWDFLPIVDCSLMSITEIAGIDRSLPLSTCLVRMMRNRGEFIETAVESARAQSHYYATKECSEGTDPFTAAGDDADGTNPGSSMGFVRMGHVMMQYDMHGEKTTFNSAKLPEPDFEAFMGVTDQRCARGFSTSNSRFTRKVDSSWAGGRMEDQQDDPLVDQIRETFLMAWRKVNQWFMEAVWLKGDIQLPHYTDSNKALWAHFRAQFPGKVHINPEQTQAAREKGFMQRTLTPQQACEEDGKDLRENMRQWAQAMVVQKAVEKEYKLDEGTLDFLVSGRTISTASGDDIGAPQPAIEPQPGETPKEPGKQPGKKNRLFFNQAGA